MVEEQGKELQKTFQDTMEQLEKEEEEIIRLRKENQSLRDQLAGRDIEPTAGRNLENVRKVGSMEDRDDYSSAESKHECISDNESVANYSRLTELNDRIVELENELISSNKPFIPSNKFFFFAEGFFFHANKYFYHAKSAILSVKTRFLSVWQENETVKIF